MKAEGSDAGPRYASWIEIRSTTAKSCQWSSNRTFRLSSCKECQPAKRWSNSIEWLNSVDSISKFFSRTGFVAQIGFCCLNIESIYARMLLLKKKPRDDFRARPEYKLIGYLIQPAIGIYHSSRFPQVSTKESKAWVSSVFASRLSSSFQSCLFLLFPFQNEKTANEIGNLIVSESKPRKLGRLPGHDWSLMSRFIFDLDQCRFWASLKSMWSSFLHRNLMPSSNWAIPLPCYWLAI